MTLSDMEARLYCLERSKISSFKDALSTHVRNCRKLRVSEIRNALRALTFETVIISGLGDALTMLVLGSIVSFGPRGYPEQSHVWNCQPL